MSQYDVRTAAFDELDARTAYLRPVAYLRVLDDGDAARIGRVLVAQTHRSRGLDGIPHVPMTRQTGR